MKKFIFKKLQEMVKENKLSFGFDHNLKEFVLKEYKEKNDSVVICTCVYIENGLYHEKFVELNLGKC